MSASAAIERSPAASPQEVRVRVRIRNDGPERLALPDPSPGSPPPELDWPLSIESYHTALLLSYNLLTLKVVGPDGKLLEPDITMPWTTHLWPADRELGTGASLEFPVVLSEFYRFTQRGPHSVDIGFGHAGRRVHAQGVVQIGALE